MNNMKMCNVVILLWKILSGCVHACAFKRLALVRQRATMASLGVGCGCQQLLHECVHCVFTVKIFSKKQHHHAGFSFPHGRPLKRTVKKKEDKMMIKTSRGPLLIIEFGLNGFVCKS